MVEAKKKLLILGAGGLLGSELMSNPCFSDWNVMGQARSPEGMGRNDFSIQNEVFTLLNAAAPDAILNLIGLTDVDRCEAFPNEAYVSNVKTLENVVGWIKTRDKPVYLVHISTDQVYDGTGPHYEKEVILRNYYAFSKYAAELVAGSVPSVILRTNFFGRSKSDKRRSLTDWLFHSLRDGREIQVFEDVLFSPLSMSTLAEMMAVALQKRITGIYNLGSHDGMSKADFAFHFAHLLNMRAGLMSRTTTQKVDFLKTYRPKDMRLDVGAFEQAADVKLPSLIVELENVTREYQNEI